MKKIVLLSDGTGNSAAKQHKTNVWRLYAALNLHDKSQIAMYDDGVGSQDSTVLKVLGGAFGYGLKRNVLELYKYLCRNYRDAEGQEPADKIYMFGFSRGAFTIRVLAGFVAHAGLCTNYGSEVELDEWARENYRHYRQRYKHGYFSRLWCQLFCKTHELHSDTYPSIEFLGVWDTVDAYAFPIDELAIIWDLLIYPIRFPDADLTEKVKHACHAISVDDERQTFHPVMWNEAGDDAARIEQVWFPGVHSDVGGGYPHHSLSLVSLDWMLSKLDAKDEQTRLVWCEDIRQQYHCQSDWNGPQHNSRAGLATYYRYKPRQVTYICRDSRDGVTIERPKMHRSVLERIRGRSLPYAPTGIPAEYAVVATEGSPPQYETPEEATKRADALNFALDMVFWRRRLYIALLFTTLALIGSRFYLSWTEGAQCQGSACLMDPLLQLAIRFLPDMFAGWFDALRQNPIALWTFIGVYAVLFLLKRFAISVTSRHAMRAWSALKGKGEPPEWKGSFTAELRGLAHTRFKAVIVWLGASVLFVGILILLVIAIFAIVNHVMDTLGGL